MPAHPDLADRFISFACGGCPSTAVAALAAWNSHAVDTLHILNASIGLWIWIMAANQGRSSVIHFLRYWYPFVSAIFGFEEVARWFLALVR